MKKKQLYEALAVLLTKLSSAKDNPLLVDNYVVKALRTVLLEFKESGELKTNANCNTQRIIDTLTANRYADLQERLEDAKRREQTTSIVAQLKTTTPTTYHLI